MPLRKHISPTFGVSYVEMKKVDWEESEDSSSSKETDDLFAYRGRKGSLWQNIRWWEERKKWKEEKAAWKNKLKEENEQFKNQGPGYYEKYKGTRMTRN